MTDYSRTGQHYPRAPHTNYNSQVYQNLEGSYMPSQELTYDTAESNPPRWNSLTSLPPTYQANGLNSLPPVTTYQAADLNTLPPVTTYQTSDLNSLPPYQANGLNGFPTNYGASMSEQPSTYHHSSNLQRSGPNGISVNTTNLPLSNPSIINTNSGRIICVADVRGNISQLNKLAEETGATAVIHTGDFGFYEDESLDRISDRTLRHLVQYSTHIPREIRNHILKPKTSLDELRQIIRNSNEPILSEFPYFRDGKKSLKVPVYAVWGACEDVSILEKFRMKEYDIPNFFILDEANTYVIDVGGVNLRLFGLGGAVVQHKLFDNGEGIATIAGGNGTMWTTMLQIGELVETAQKVYDSTETRVLVTQTSPGREGLLAQLSLVLRADFTISAGIHFRYCISYNEYSVQHDSEHFRKRLEESRKSFYDLWATVRSQVESSIDISQRPLLDNAISVVDRVPASGREEAFFKNMWHFNLPDAAFGWVLLDIKEGRISAETKAHGFNFAYRREAIPGGPAAGVSASPSLVDSQTKRQTTQWQSSPVLPPQPANGGAPIHSLILTPQRSTSPVTSSDLHSNWKQPPSHNWMESSSSTEVPSSSQKAGVEDLNMDRTPPKVNGNNTSVNETIDDINNNTINNNEVASVTSSEHDDSNNIDGNQETRRWADQAQIEDVGESSQSQVNDENQNNEDGSTNNNSSVQQNRYQYNNNRRANGKFSYSPFSVQVGNLTVPVSEKEIKDFFISVECQVERVKLIHDRSSKEQLDHCYVDFQDGSSLDKAIQLNGQPFGPNQNPLKIRKTDPENRTTRWRGGRGRGRGNFKHRGGGHGNNGGNHTQNGGPQ